MDPSLPPETLIGISSHNLPGFRPLVDFKTWQVALMRHIDELLPERIDRMQRHDETDEVFVLLAGRCILFLGEGELEITNIHAVEMQPGKVYNVKKGAWHTHVFSKEGLVLIVENSDTTDDNSPFLALDVLQRRQIVSACAGIWQTYR